MAEIKFYLDKRTDKNGSPITADLPIFLFYSFNGQRLKYFTGERIDLRYFLDPKVKKNRGKWPIVSSAPNAERISDRLRALKSHLESFHTSAKALGIKPSTDYFRSKLNEVWKPALDKEELSVEQALDMFLQVTRVNKAHNTYRNTRTFVNHVKTFIGSKRTAIIDIDSAFVDRFKTNLVGKNLLNNSVAKNLRVLRTFLNWCHGQKYISKLDITVEIKENPIDVIFLSYDEIMHLYNHKIKKEYLRRVRDVFIFACFTGMRHSDLAKLKKADVKDGMIKFFITKGNNTVSNTVPLSSVSRAIIEKYAHWPGEKALPVISNQKMNEALKAICEDAKLDEVITVAEKKGNGRVVETQYKKWELITCHVARKSFITVAMILGMPEAVVKSITGHSKNSKAFARYYDIIDSHKKAEMDKIFK